MNRYNISPITRFGVLCMVHIALFIFTLLLSPQKLYADCSPISSHFYNDSNYRKPLFSLTDNGFMARGVSKNYTGLISIYSPGSTYPSGYVSFSDAYPSYVGINDAGIVIVVYIKEEDFNRYIRYYNEFGSPVSDEIPFALPIVPNGRYNIHGYSTDAIGNTIMVYERIVTEGPIDLLCKYIEPDGSILGPTMIASREYGSNIYFRDMDVDASGNGNYIIVWGELESRGAYIPSLNRIRAISSTGLNSVVVSNGIDGRDVTGPLFPFNRKNHICASIDDNGNWAVSYVTMENKIGAVVNGNKIDVLIDVGACHSEVFAHSHKHCQSLDISNHNEDFLSVVWSTYSEQTRCYKPWIATTTWGGEVICEPQLIFYLYDCDQDIYIEQNACGHAYAYGWSENGYSGYVGSIGGPFWFECWFLQELIANFSVSQNPAGNSVVQFLDTSTGDPVSWYWDFGDGNKSRIQNPVHTYPAGCDASWDVRLEITNETGCSDEQTATVSVWPNAANPAPKAVLVRGYASNNTDPFMMGDLLWKAEELFSNRGWETVIAEDPTIGELTTLLEDPSVSGLYIVAHGKTVYDISYISLRTEQNKEGHYSPMDLAHATGGRLMDFVTVIACDQDKSLWDFAFNVDPDNVTMPWYTIPIWGSAIIPIERVAATYLSHGINHTACENDELEMVMNENLKTYHVSLESNCGSFLSTQNGLTGSDLYPVYSCATETGLLVNGEYTVDSPDGMFSVSFISEEAYEDSISLSATYFEIVPDTLVYNGPVPIGRYLYYTAIMEDSLLELGSYEVEMRYTNEDVLAAGIFSENQLDVYWLSDDSRFIFVDTVLDTILNSISFSVPGSGIVGIYASATTEDNVDMPLHTDIPTLYQNFPNPLNPTTTIEYFLPSRCSVLLQIFDVSGKHIATLVNDSQENGFYSIDWNGKDLNGSSVSSGIYIYRLKAGKETLSKKMVLLR
ncbi:MAG: T9SS type A sorting domain-containing protein [Candidatus Krumholzibacteriota bacterium]|nr:T9SS type A sorting domain-containing protein [Candidatus Krumholzibacteriota bacterium]